MPIIVMVTEGKGDSVEYVTIELFDDYNNALNFCKIHTTAYPSKYWKNAEIVTKGSRCELGKPEYWNKG